jgi:anti-sigma factor RsiW
MTDSNPDDEADFETRLAGYADGELSASDRRAVERWLEVRPDAAEALREQESLARSSAEFWASVEPPPPTPAEWERIRTAIEDRCFAAPATASLRRSRRVASLLAVAATGLLAALGTWWWSAPEALPEASGQVSWTRAVAPPPRPVDDPLAEFAVLPVADIDDVYVESVRGPTPAWVYAGDHPVPGEMPLAGPGDLILLEVRPSAGRSETATVILTLRP